MGEREAGGAPTETEGPARRHGIGSLGVVIVIAVAVLITCGGYAAVRWANRDRAAVEETVRRYNHELMAGFASLNMTVLEDSATRDQAYTEYVYMAALGEERVRLKATLQSLDIKNVSVESTSATADTVERWDYEQVSLDTSQTVRTEKNVVYHLSYRLVKQRDRWLIDEVKFTGQSWRWGPGSEASQTVPGK